MITSWEGKYPKFFSEEFDTDVFQSKLLSRLEKISLVPPVYLPVLDMHKKLEQALFMSQKDGALTIGLNPMEKRLQMESSGLSKLANMDKASAPRRISRLILISNDGSFRFQRDISRLITTHEPRTAGVILDCNSKELCRIVLGKQGVIKAVLAHHKNSLGLILSAMGRIV